MKAKTYNNVQLLGLMSGTSLDGLDIAWVSFDFTEPKSIDFELLNCQTFPLPAAIHQELSRVHELKATRIFELHQELAHFYSVCIEEFTSKHQIKKNNITAIALHGQTIFHQPQKGFTTQIGCGITLNYLTKIPVIDQFRQLDVSAGGQGAPLVPLGDALLFSKLADGFLNLGGFANISTLKNQTSIAFDIAPANLPMNQWVQTIGLAFDSDGQLARQGKVDESTLQTVLALSFFDLAGPKSLGTEWLAQNYLPLFKHLSIQDRLRTHLEVLKTLCLSAFEDLSVQDVLVTGGGAFNLYFIELLQNAFKGKIIVPEATLINYKEALIFAFLGARFLRNEPTTICSVTGASAALKTGVLHDFQAKLR